MALEGHNREVLCCSFGKDSQSSHIIATGGSDNTIKLWDLRIRKCMYTIPVHKRHVVDVSFNKTGEYLCSSSFDNTIGLFSLPTMSIVGSLYGHGNKVSRVHWWDEEVNRKNSGNFDVMDDGMDTSGDQLLNDNIEGKIISTSFDTTFKVWG
jgi:WD40 repeat protein